MARRVDGDRRPGHVGEGQELQPTPTDGLEVIRREIVEQ